MLEYCRQGNRWLGIGVIPVITAMLHTVLFIALLHLHLYSHPIRCDELLDRSQDSVLVLGCDLLFVSKETAKTHTNCELS